MALTACSLRRTEMPCWTRSVHFKADGKISGCFSGDWPAHELEPIPVPVQRKALQMVIENSCDKLEAFLLQIRKCSVTWVDAAEMLGAETPEKCFSSPLEHAHPEGSHLGRWSFWLWKNCLIYKRWKNAGAYPNPCFQGSNDHVLILAFCFLPL